MCGVLRRVGGRRRAAGGGRTRRWGTDAPLTLLPLRPVVGVGGTNRRPHATSTSWMPPRVAGCYPKAGSAPAQDGVGTIRIARNDGLFRPIGPVGLPIQNWQKAAPATLARPGAWTLEIALRGLPKRTTALGLRRAWWAPRIR